MGLQVCTVAVIFCVTRLRPYVVLRPKSRRGVAFALIRDGRSSTEVSQERGQHSGLFVNVNVHDFCGFGMEWSSEHFADC